MNALLEYLEGHNCGEGLNPTPYYNRAGNQIEWYWKDERCYAESIYDKEGKWIGSLERSMATHEVVGVKIFCEAIDVRS